MGRKLLTESEKKAKKRIQQLAWQKRYPEKVARRGVRYRARHKEKDLARKRLYRINNADKINALTAFHRAVKVQATPLWANKFFISEAYHLAALRTKITGLPWEVDHIVPLRSKKVCGLHVEHNLRVILASENHSKGNRYWPDMP